MKRGILLLAMTLCFQLLIGQFQVQYLHTNPLKFSLNDFNRVRIFSASEKSNVRVIYTFLDAKKNKIIEINFKLTDMKTGWNNLNYSSANLVWHNTPFRDLLAKDQLVSGNFQLCVGVTDVYESIPETEDCFDIELTSVDIDNELNTSPIELQSPNHKDTIEERRPLLTWIPPSPTYQGTEYLLLLVDKKENQTCTEALNNNIPIINKKDIPTNILNYPSEAQPLTKGQKYCWRASAYKDLKEYSRSEDWEFSLEGEEDTIIKSIPLINNLTGGVISVSGTKVLFGIENYSNSSLLRIQLDATGQIQNYPMKYGYNLITLNIDNLKVNERKLITCDGVNNTVYNFFILKTEK